MRGAGDVIRARTALVGACLLVAGACGSTADDARPVPSVTVEILTPSTTDAATEGNGNPSSTLVTVPAATATSESAPPPEHGDLSGLEALVAAWPIRQAPTDFPTPETTGLRDRSLLEVHEGSLIVKDDGAVIENLEIRGTLEIRGAQDVLVRNVWVYVASFWTVYTTQGGSMTIEDSEIGHPDHLGERGLGGHNVTARRLDIHHVEDGIKVGSNSTYDWVVCHDLGSRSDDPHYDCVQADGGVSNALFRRVSLDPTPARAGIGNQPESGNAAWFIKSDLGPIDNVTIVDSYIAGGGYSIFAPPGGEYPAPTNVRVINNLFAGTDIWGLLYEQPFIVWYHNVSDRTGGAAYRDDGPVPTAAPFEDIAGSGREADVAWLYWAGVADGCAATEFCPDDAISRGDFAAWLWRAGPLAGAALWSSGDAAEPAIVRLAAAGIVDGCGGSDLCEADRLSEADAVEWLQRAFGLPVDTAHIDPEAVVARADAAWLLRRALG